MSRNQNNVPEMDYYELRRRHEEYKARSSAPVRPRIEPKAETPAEDIENVQPAQPEPVKEARPEAAPEADRSFEEEIEAEERENARPEGDAPASDNPFASFLQFASRVKGKMRPRRGGRRSDEEDAYDDVDFDEALDAAPAEHDDDGVDLSDDPREYEDAIKAGNIADVEFTDPAQNRAPHAHIDDDYGDAGYDDEDYDEYADEPYDDADEDASSDDQPHGFKKFLNLFITRVDPDEETDDEPYDDGYYDDDYEDEYPEEATDDAAAEDSEEFGSVYFQEPTVSRRNSVPSGIEGGHKDMDDMQNLSSEHIHQMAEGLENSGMTRRERRELAQRRAAEEAAKREAEAKAAAPVQSVYDAPAQAEAETPAPAAEAPAVEKAEDVPAEQPEETPAPETFVGVVEEPTREFKPVSRAAEDASADDLFDVDADDESDADDDEDDEEYEDDRKPRRGLFGWRARKHAKADIEDEDFDDEGDEDDDADEDDDDDSRSRKRRRKRRAEEEDEDEFDEEYADDSQDDD